jgi:hypothetical protein
LSFHKSNEDKVNECLKKLDVHEDIEKKETILRSDLMIFFLSNKFVTSDHFKADWKEKEKKLFLIVLLENIEQISSLDLNDSILFNFDDSVDSKEIKRFQIFLSRLIDFKSIKSNQIVMIESSELKSKTSGLRGYLFCKNNYVQKLEFIKNDKVIMQTHDKSTKYKIVVINWIADKIISKINIEHQYHLDFCWIEHLNQLLVYQDYVNVKKFLLFTISGDLVRQVFSENTIKHIMSAISYNKDKFEVYLNVFDTISSSGSILILNDEFTLIKKLSSNIMNSDIPLNYLSEIEILNIQYNIFHHNTNYAFIQEKNFIYSKCFYYVYIFDKSSYSIVGVIETRDRLIAYYEGKLLLSSNDSHLFQTIQNIRFPNFRDSSAYCKINPFKQVHLLSNPYLLPCGSSACLDCIYSHYNVFKKIFICPMCKKEHNLKFNQLKASDIILLFNQDVCTAISDKLKSIIHDKGRTLDLKFFSPFLFLFFKTKDGKILIIFLITKRAKLKFALNH